MRGIGEFGAIARLFRPLAAPPGRGLADDAAVLRPEPGQELVFTADTLIAGVHFFAGDPPAMIARKALRVNLSDLAAMGATPLHYLLALSLPEAADLLWLEAFAAGLAADQAEFGVSLIGGDTTTTPGPLTVTISMIGQARAGTAVGRDGARDGDMLLISGSIGDAGLGLRARAPGGAAPRVDDPDGSLVARYLLPRPRLGLVRADLVHAAIDVSDGLLQDAGHIARASGLTCEIMLEDVPVSAAALRAGGAAARMEAVAAGDDYELALAAPPASQAALVAHAASLGIALTRAGRFRAAADGAPSVVLRDAAGADITPTRKGWTHF